VRFIAFLPVLNSVGQGYMFSNQRSKQHDLMRQTTKTTINYKHIFYWFHIRKLPIYWSYNRS